MSQHEYPSGTPSSPAQQPSSGYPAPQSPAPQYGQSAGAPGYQPGAAPTNYAPTLSTYAERPPSGAPKQRNIIGLIALIVAIVGFIFACIPGALIVGWVLLPVAFILSIVSFFQRGKGKGFGIAALIVSVVGTIVGAIVFFAVVASSFEQAFSEGSTVVTEPSANATDESAAPVEEAAAEPEAATEEGTRENPLPVGSTISNDDWTVTVNAYNAAGNDIVAGANQFNEPPASGSHYEIVNYTVTYTGDESDYAMMVGVDLVTASGNVIDTTESFVALEDSIGMDELFNGASTTGSTAFLVPDGESILVRVRPGMFGDEVFVQP